MRMLTGMLLVFGLASGARAADESLLELSDNYFQCAAFYQGAAAEGLLPSGRTRSSIARTVNSAIEVAVGVEITAREGPRRMTQGELASMKRKVDAKALGFAAEFRKDRGYAKGWIAEVFADCDEKMQRAGAKAD